MRDPKFINPFIFSSTTDLSGNSDMYLLNENSLQLDLGLPDFGNVNLNQREESERSELTMDLHTLAGVIIPTLDITEKTR